MKKQIWFRTKRYGWGWYPSTWQGWGILVLYLVAMGNNSRSIVSVSKFTFETFLMTVGLIAICYVTGEKPRWRWGK